MIKNITATISSSMRFYSEEVDRLDIFNWPLFFEIYEPSTEPINFAEMTEEEKKEQLERLLEDHKAKMRKSDYLIVINKNGYIGNGVREEIEYANEIGLGIIYTEYSPKIDAKCLGKIAWKGNVYYLTYPDLRYMDDSITKYTDFVLERGIKKIQLAAVAGVPNVNGYQYDKKEIIKAINDKRMTELFDSGRMRVEWGNSADKIKPDNIRHNTIDPKFVVGNVILLGSTYLFIKTNDEYDKVFHNISNRNLLAYMRYLGESHKRDNSDIKDVTDIKIITWDIWHNDLSKEYLKIIS